MVKDIVVISTNNQLTYSLLSPELYPNIIVA